jgi:hypothetical protein
MFGGAKGRQKCFRITGAPAQNLLIYPQRTTSSNPKLSVLLPEIETVKFHFRSITCSPQMTPNRSIYFALEALNPRFPNLNNSPAPPNCSSKIKSFGLRDHQCGQGTQRPIPKCGLQHIPKQKSDTESKFLIVFFHLTSFSLHIGI